MIDIKNMIIGRKYPATIDDKKMFFKMIKGNGYWDFPDRKRVIGFGGSIYDAYDNYVIKVK